MQSSIERTVSGVRCTNDDLKPVLVALATDQPLDVRYRDHDLSGDWAGYRECHIKPDLLLIYRALLQIVGGDKLIIPFC
ncbi:type II toxin-antitoxin system YafQ family toxin [Klebsiella pneumoniae]|uniref:type II toxin-antitoxin system YafQ family toxin n=2 Tax=Klebsiella pneumoniae TaxID=573 RepID=UPI00141A1DDF|nr:type II toxin-antitoxin system YafQ family toxin [Klebsiella pneumoniae]MCL0562951.1 type II toxin-antitoxin system YafQ family toxin [Klebsiella pneumoniae]MEB5590075.1 type II toxin-antitoxin system YafQ family toxin [Klebsiella pneumoniae]MEB5609150.1 type II toxin-antitoxin system YafQ family toxin [Klebsiella pneumoniae]NIC64914.1 type II toxin-antitoxin system YafQ family toxin [Klebsiella pneumoniae]UNT77084.1 type II toxin-antitoxin system YafQ family toxin [Klebsiella pneumoniae]